MTMVFIGLGMFFGFISWGAGIAYGETPAFQVRKRKKAARYAIAFQIAAAVFLFSAGIAWVQP